MKILIAVTVLLSATAMAAPCKDKATCTSACEGGDPAACVIALDGEPNTPLEKRTLPSVNRDRKTVDDCDDLTSEHNCNLYAAHLWAGVGIKQNRSLAVKLWGQKCEEDYDTTGCLPHAKATFATDAKSATEEYVWACSRRNELACKAGAKIWVRRSGVAGLRYGLETKETIPFTIELPAVLVEHSWTGAWYFPYDNSSGGWADIQVYVNDGQLACQRPSKPRVKADAPYLEAGWDERACKSILGAPTPRK